MVSDQQLRRIERENGVLFGLKWSALGCALALCFLLSACSLFDSGAVRYNSVVGEKRVPSLNPGGVGYASTEMAKNQMQQNQMVVQNYAAPPMAVQDASMSSEAAALFAANQQQAAMMPPSQAPAAASMAAPAMPADGSYPQLPPTQTQSQPMGNDAAIKAEIDALERDMAATQSQRQQMASQEKDSSWLPNLGVSDWFGSSAPQQVSPSAPQMPASGGYAPVQLPPPPLAGGGAPMPPVINEPYQPPTAAEMAAVPAPSGSVEVPLAPLVGSTAPTNVPSSLIPPGATLAPNGGYLQDSRYSSRRNYSKP